MKLNKKQKKEIFNKYWLYNYRNLDIDKTKSELCKEYQISTQELEHVLKDKPKRVSKRYRSSYKRERPEQLKCTGHRFIVKNKTAGEVRNAISDFSGIKKIQRNANGDVEIIHTTNHRYTKWYKDIQKLTTKIEKIDRREFLRAKHIVENYEECSGCKNIDVIDNLEETTCYGYEKYWCEKCYNKVKDDND